MADGVGKLHSCGSRAALSASEVTLFSVIKFSLSDSVAESAKNLLPPALLTLAAAAMTAFRTVLKMRAELAEFYVGDIAHFFFSTTGGVADGGAGCAGGNSTITLSESEFTFTSEPGGKPLSSSSFLVRAL